MQETLERFAAEVRKQRKKRHLTQRQLADILRMHQRTIIDIENCNTIPGFDTVIYIARELDISLDPILFPSSISSGITKSVTDFFRDKDEAEIQKYISLCRIVESIYADEVEISI